MLKEDGLKDIEVPDENKFQDLVNSGKLRFKQEGYLGTQVTRPWSQIKKIVNDFSEQDFSGRPALYKSIMTKSILDTSGNPKKIVDVGLLQEMARHQEKVFLEGGMDPHLARAVAVAGANRFNALVREFMLQNTGPGGVKAKSDDVDSAIREHLFAPFYHAAFYDTERPYPFVVRDTVNQINNSQRTRAMGAAAAEEVNRPVGTGGSNIKNRVEALTNPNFGGPRFVTDSPTPELDDFGATSPYKNIAPR